MIRCKCCVDLDWIFLDTYILAQFSLNMRRMRQMRQQRKDGSRSSMQLPCFGNEVISKIECRKSLDIKIK